MDHLLFEKISIRGRIAYCIMCFESYTKIKYPNIDFNPVYKYMWNIVDDCDYIDNSAYKYMEIIPEYLYEFDSYETADFEYISENEFFLFRSIINSSDEALNTIMHCIYDIAMEYAYEAIHDYGKATFKYISDVIAILKENKISLPDIDKVSSFTFDKFGGWGDFIKPDGLSQFIK